MKGAGDKPDTFFSMPFCQNENGQQTWSDILKASEILGRENVAWAEENRFEVSEKFAKIVNKRVFSLKPLTFNICYQIIQMTKVVQSDASGNSVSHIKT